MPTHPSTPFHLNLLAPRGEKQPDAGRLLNKAGGVASVRHLGGLTLIELLVTLSITAIVLSLGVVGFSELIAKNSMTSSVNAFISAAQLARSEAVTRGQPVSLCPDDPDTGAFDCTGAAAWHVGYTVFSDVNENGDIDNPDDVIIRKIEGRADARIEITGTTGDGASLTYISDGTPESADANNPIAFEFRDANGTANPKDVEIWSTGWPSCKEACSDGSWKDCAVRCP